MRIFGSHTSRPATEHQKKIRKTDAAFSLMIRERDVAAVCIACARTHTAWGAGHYRRREIMSTRFHPWNVNKGGGGCNRGTHNNKYGMKDMDLYRENLDSKWGKGTADYLYELSKKIEPFTIIELKQLTHAAKLGSRAYEQFYFQIRPPHRA
jgi:Bacteriophage Lambda NinG protein